MDGKSFERSQSYENNENGGEVTEWQKLSEVGFAPDEKPPVLEKSKLDAIAQGARNVARGVEDEYYRYIRREARREGLSSDELLSEVREANKELRFGESKEQVKFYHSTSMEGLSAILESGELLSRKKRAERGEDISKLPWSSSENVQFSNDTFDTNGEMTSSGLGGGRGAIGSELSFVFGGDLIDEKSFDASFEYPTVEEVNLSEKCLGIVVKDAAQVDAVRNLLKQKNIAIPVYSAEEYDPKSTNHDLQVKKAEEGVMRVYERQKNNAVESVEEEVATTDEAEVLPVEKDTPVNDKEDFSESVSNEVEVTEAETIKEEATDTAETDTASFEPSDEDPTLELMTEDEVRGIAGLLDASQLNIDRLLGMSRGSRSAEQAAAALKTISQKMLEQSAIFLNGLQNGKNIGEVNLYQSVYEQDMEKGYGYSLQALKALRDQVQGTPPNLRGPMVFDIQQIENNLQMANSLVQRRHDRYNRDENPVLPKEKIAADEAEAQKYTPESPTPFGSPARS